jgi:predicted transcriptional regulator YheO
MEEITVNIKYTSSEVGLLINSLVMTCTTQVPTEDSGQWKKPYEKLLKDLKNIKSKTLEYKEKRENIEKRKSTETQNPTECGPCD